MKRFALITVLCLLTSSSIAGPDFDATKALAEKGDAYAQYSLAIMYGTGDGVPQDYAQAAKWSRKAADQGDASAQNSLGMLYSNGLGVPQDYAEAVKWYRKAASQGKARAQFNLGNMYGGGKGVSKNIAEAYVWVSLAAESGDKDAIKIHAILTNSLTPQELSAAQNRANLLSEEIQTRKKSE